MRGGSHEQPSPGCPPDPVEVGQRARQDRLELRRRGVARSRQHDALLARAAQQLAEGGRVLRTRPARVLLLQAEHAGRDQLAGELARRGLDVVGLLADAELGVQLATAVQPELVVVEEGLPGLDAAHVLGSVRQACRHAHLVALVMVPRRCPPCWPPAPPAPTPAGCRPRRSPRT